MNKCNTCAYYQPRTCYCEYYLRGKETAVYLCPHCRSESEVREGAQSIIDIAPTIIEAEGEKEDG